MVTSFVEPSTLTQEEISQFWQDGFLVIKEVFSSQEVDYYRQSSEVPAIHSEQVRRGYQEKITHLLEITVRHPTFKELACHPKITERLAGLIGPNLQLQHSKLATKPPHQGRGLVRWHQDFPFFPHTNTDLVAVTIMLDNADIENGCLQAIKGSHKLGYLDHDVLTTIPKFVEQNPGMRISLLHLDLDLYEPTLIALQCLYPLVVKGGAIVFDEYAFENFPGETKAVEDYFGDNLPRIQKFDWFGNPGGFFFK